LDEHVILGGDFNIRTSEEDAYEALMNDSLFYDPLSRPGNWHNSVAFIDIHTQSTRARVINEGSAGGMDDRYDFLVMSDEFNKPGGWTYSERSYTAFGNDGAVREGSYRFNRSIMSPVNLIVSSEMAEALHYGSDHLPVYAEIVFNALHAEDITVNVPESLILSAFPNPFNLYVQFRYSIDVSGDFYLGIYDLNGDIKTELVTPNIRSGAYIHTWNPQNLPAGLYFARMSVGKIEKIIKLALVK